jgi:uncharacterized protein YjbI with pentapeptide repeats
MANEEQVLRLRTSVEEWNVWRRANPSVEIDLNRADLSQANLNEANLNEANLNEANLNEANLMSAAFLWANLNGATLKEANLNGANLSMAGLSNANLSEANLLGVTLIDANLNGANLSGANLSQANLIKADLTGANLSGADLTMAILVEANLTQAIMNGCLVHGVSAWSVQLEGATQTNLRITSSNEPEITVDNLEVAQFLYLMLHNEKIRDLLETITSKVVLILGRFSEDRKPVLDALRNALREHPKHYVPVLFDFDVPAGKHIMETVGLLARMARFVIADITDPNMVRTELALIAPMLPSVPIQPLLLDSAALFTEFGFFEEFPWVLPIYRYRDLPQLLSALPDHVIGPAELRIQERAQRQR